MRSTSKPSSSIGIGTVENDDTLSTMSRTSGYLRTTAAMSATGLITPVDVSLWMSVTASKPPSASFASTISGRIGSPHSTRRPSACLPQRLLTSSHLSENAPHMQLRTFFCTRLRIEPSITPQADEVER